MSFVKSQKCPYHVTFDLNLDLQHIVGADQPHMCEFGRDPAICLGEKPICTKCLQTDRRTDGQRTTE